MPESDTSTIDTIALTAGEQLVADFVLVSSNFTLADSLKDAAALLESGLTPYLVHPVTRKPFYVAGSEAPEDIRRQLQVSSLDLILAQLAAREAAWRADKLARNLSREHGQHLGRGVLTATALTPNTLPISAVNQAGEAYKHLGQVAGRFLMSNLKEGLLYLRPTHDSWRKASHYMIQMFDAGTHEPTVAITIDG